MTESIEFVNDWSELENAIAFLSKLFDHGYVDISVGYDDDCWDAVNVIKDYVPRLLTQYANLVELSFALTEGWEQYAALQAPTGLYLPDHR